MQYKQVILLFFRFLKEKKIYNSYLHQVENYLSIVRRDKTYNAMAALYDKLPSGYVAGFFSWMTSKEGYSFWANINIEWNRVLGQYRRKCLT